MIYISFCQNFTEYLVWIILNQFWIDVGLMQHMKTRGDCRVCKSKNLQKVISLGNQPPANAFLKKEELAKKEPFFPLECYFCKNCSFVQLSDIVDPELLFKDYVYVSSTSTVFVQHFKELAEKVCGKFKLQKNSLVVDIGSNDGILLRPFKENGMEVLGIDPAEKIAALATKNGIETLPGFFTPSLAEKIVKERGKAKIITATSVFSHVDDLDGFVEGVEMLIDSDGVFIIEVYYMKSLIGKNLFDTIYHEHLSYFTVKTISALLERLGMELFDVELTDTHGGSLRVFCQKKNGPHNKENSINAFLQEEEKEKLHELQTYKKFSEKIEANKKALVKLLKDLKSKGKKIAGYGAPAKGNTLLNYFGIGPETLDYIVDDSPWKQGLYSPGMHIPVKGFEQLSKEKPDYILILAWNYAEPIMKKCTGMADFMLPVPKPKIVREKN